MGDGDDERDFDSWVNFLCQNIDEAAGFPVAVDVRLSSDVQSDEISGGTPDQLVAIAEAARDLWQRWRTDDSV
jgi:hypothetical protein